MAGRAKTPRDGTLSRFEVAGVLRAVRSLRGGWSGSIQVARPDGAATSIPVVAWEPEVVERLSAEARSGEWLHVRGHLACRKSGAFFVSQAVVTDFTVGQ